MASPQIGQAGDSHRQHRRLDRQDVANGVENQAKGASPAWTMPGDVCQACAPRSRHLARTRQGPRGEVTKADAHGVRADFVACCQRLHRTGGFLKVQVRNHGVGL